MRIARKTVAVLALLWPLVANAQSSGDAELGAIGDAYYRASLDYYAQLEQSDGTTEAGDHLPTTTPASILAEAEREKGWLARLNAMPSFKKATG